MSRVWIFIYGVLPICVTKYSFNSLMRANFSTASIPQCRDFNWYTNWSFSPDNMASLQLYKHNPKLVNPLFTRSLKEIALLISDNREFERWKQRSQKTLTPAYKQGQVAACGTARWQHLSPGPRIPGAHRIVPFKSQLIAIKGNNDPSDPSYRHGTL